LLPFERAAASVSFEVRLLISRFPRFLSNRSELNDAILEIVSGHGENVKEQYHSDIREYAKKIKWDKEGDEI